MQANHSVIERHELSMMRTCTALTAPEKGDTEKTATASEDNLDFNEAAMYQKLCLYTYA
jgi:hypothetical protein